MTEDRAWFVRVPRTERPLRLYCFAHAGGNATSYLDWQSSMPAHVEVCGVQLPGRGARFGEKPGSDLPALIDELSAVFRRTVDRPFAFFGHSLGALIAFELARRLARDGACQPGRLFVSGCHAPRHRGASRDRHLLGDAALMDILRDYGGTSADIFAEADLMKMLLPTIRADFALAETYRYHPSEPLNMPVHALAGRSDVRDGPHQVTGWAEETQADFACHWFDGGHFFLHEHRDLVIDVIAASLPSLLPRPLHDVALPRQEVDIGHAASGSVQASLR